MLGGFGTGTGTGGSGSADGQLADPRRGRRQRHQRQALRRRHRQRPGRDLQTDRDRWRIRLADRDHRAEGPGDRPGDGDVYVANAAGISKFTAAIAPAAGWTRPRRHRPARGRSPSGDLLVADTAANLIRRFDSSGTADGTFAATRPVDLAANSAGDVFVVTTTGDIASRCGPTSAVERFSAAGVSKGTLPSLTVPGSVAVDPDDDSIVVGAKVNEYFCEQNNPPEIVFFDSTGAFQEANVLSPATYWAAVPGLAARGGGSTRDYALTRSPVNDPYGATQIVALEDLDFPVVTIASASNVAPFSATLRGEVNPEGHATTCRFEYSIGTSFNKSVPCAVNPGRGRARSPSRSTSAG